MNVKLKFIDKESQELYSGNLSVGSSFSAGYDLRIREDLTLQPGETALAGSGIAIWINDRNYVAKIYPRSGLGHKNGIVLGNLTGVIDADYQGEIKLSLWNRSNQKQFLKKGDRVCQMVFEHVVHPEFQIVDDFNEKSDRNSGGFGSSGS